MNTLQNAEFTSTWNEYRVDLLCFGYLRENFNVYVDDIARLLLTYIGCVSKLIKSTTKVYYDYDTIGMRFAINNYDQKNLDNIGTNLYIFGCYSITYASNVFMESYQCTLQRLLCSISHLSKINSINYDRENQNKIDLNEHIGFESLIEQKKFGLRYETETDGPPMLSFFIKNDIKYGDCLFTMFVSIKQYNIFDIINKKWIFKENKMVNQSHTFPQGLYINTINSTDSMNLKSNINYNNENINYRLLILSEYRRLYFYQINDLSSPYFIKKYSIKTGQRQYKSNFVYLLHGMVCISQRKNSFTLLLFGGNGDQAFCQTFVEFTISFVDKNDNHDPTGLLNSGTFDKLVSIEENKVNVNLEYLNDEYQQMVRQHIGEFGYHCILNGKNEQCIVIIAPSGGVGLNQYDHSIMVYNCVSKHLFCIAKVLPYSMKKAQNDTNANEKISTCLHNDHIHVMQSHGHYLIDLNVLLWLFPNQM